MFSKKLHDWYSFTEYDVIRNGGWSLLRRQTSLQRLLEATYPNFNWETENFTKAKTRAPRGFWLNVDNQRSELERIGQALGVKEVSASFHPMFRDCDSLMPA